VSNIASVLTTDLLRFEVAPNTQYSYDDLIVYSDELRSTTTFTHNDANEQTAMTVDGTTTNFAYDAWGRLTSRTRGSLAASMTYRYGDRLHEVTSNFPGEAAAVEYNYDGMGLRRAALVNGTDLTWWRWNGMSVYSEHEVSASTPWDIAGGDTIKTHFPGLGYAEPGGGYPMMTFKFYTTDHLGSVRGIWDGEWGSTVNNLATYDYTPYGDILQQSGLPLDVGFTGHHWDNHIQQYFAPFRFYNPTTLRWNMRDPLGFIDGPNVYAYVGGNPVMRIDPDGLFWDSAVINFLADIGDCLGGNPTKYVPPGSVTLPPYVAHKTVLRPLYTVRKTAEEIRPNADPWALKVRRDNINWNKNNPTKRRTPPIYAKLKKYKVLKPLAWGTKQVGRVSPILVIADGAYHWSRIARCV